MSIGVQITKATNDATMTNLTTDLNVAFDEIRQVQAWMVTQGSAGLQALGYTEGEAAIILSAFSDLDTLRTIYEGSAALAQARDFRTFAKQLYGTGYRS